MLKLPWYIKYYVLISAFSRAITMEDATVGIWPFWTILNLSDQPILNLFLFTSFISSSLCLNSNLFNIKRIVMFAPRLYISVAKIDQYLLDLFSSCLYTWSLFNTVKCPTKGYGSEILTPELMSMIILSYNLSICKRILTMTAFWPCTFRVSKLYSKSQNSCCFSKLLKPESVNVTIGVVCLTLILIQ